MRYEYKGNGRGNGMIKGTTPEHIFSLPFGTEMIKTIEITYAQNDTVKLTKGNDDCTFDGSNVSVKLTQEETLLFIEDTCVEVQIRVLTMGGDVVASHIMRISCDDCLSDGVLK